MDDVLLCLSTSKLSRLVSIQMPEHCDWLKGLRHCLCVTLRQGLGLKSSNDWTILALREPTKPVSFEPHQSLKPAVAGCFGRGILIHERRLAVSISLLLPHCPSIHSICAPVEEHYTLHNNPWPKTWIRTGAIEVLVLRRITVESNKLYPSSESSPSGLGLRDEWLLILVSRWTRAIIKPHHDTIRMEGFGRYLESRPTM